MKSFARLGVVLASLFALLLVVGCTTNTEEESSPDGADESTGSSEDALTTGCNNLTLADVRAKRFAGKGRCCKGLYNVRGEAGGYCAWREGQRGSTCAFALQFCGGWGCAGTITRYAATCGQ